MSLMLFEDVGKVPLANHDDVVQAFPVGNLRSEILVVQSVQNRRQCVTYSLDGTGDRRVLVQR